MIRSTITTNSPDNDNALRSALRWQMNIVDAFDPNVIAIVSSRIVGLRGLDGFAVEVTYDFNPTEAYNARALRDANADE